MSHPRSFQCGAMCVLVALAFLCLPLAVHASAASGLSNLSFAISAGRWLLKDRVEVYYLRVQGAGANQAEAREQAFRLAVAQAIGTLLVSETELRDGRIVREEIIAHSSGMIHDFNVIETRIEAGTHLVVLDAWVAKSEIANRVLSRSKDAGRIEGERISQQIESYKETRRSGDSLITAVLSDFPSRAFSVSLGKTRVKTDNQRGLHLIVPVRVTWDTVWLKSLAEAAELASHQPGCQGWLFRRIDECRNRVKLLVGTRGGYFDDEIVEKIVERAMWDDPPRIRLTILDSRDRVVFRDCWHAPSITASGGNFFKLNRGLLVDPDTSASIEMSISLQETAVSGMERAHVDVVRNRFCP